MREIKYNMDFITLLTEKTLNIFNINFNTINNILSKEHYLKIDNLILKLRKQKIQTNAEHIFQLVEKSIIAIYSEILKYLLVLLIATCLCLGIVLPTFIVMTLFTLLRSFAGGVHLSTFNKCFGAMILCFLSLGWVVTQIHIYYEYLIIGYLFCLYLAYKYAPQEREDKSDKDCDHGNVKKHRSIIFVTLCFIISIILFNSHQMISIGIFFGILLEIFTITPIGTRFFKLVDGGYK